MTLNTNERNLEMKKTTPIKVTIVGDYLVFRNGLKLLLKSNEDLRVIADAADIPEARLSISSQLPDVLLVNASETESEELAEFLIENGKKIPTLVLTNSKDRERHEKYLLLGASGVVTKEQDSKVLFKAIKQVSSNDYWFKRDVMKGTIEKLLLDKHNNENNVNRDKYATLTRREKEVLTNICKGMKNKAIAEDLFITETTVRHHLTSIFEKLNVKSRLSLAILAFNEGLVEIPAVEESYADMAGR